MYGRGDRPAPAAGALVTLDAARPRRP
ncbi:hypothetical protein GA0115246_115421, partial [Streptomyces sp. SolWspMP-sol7th]